MRTYLARLGIVTVFGIASTLGCAAAAEPSDVGESEGAASTSASRRLDESMVFRGARFDYQLAQGRSACAFSARFRGLSGNAYGSVMSACTDDALFLLVCARGTSCVETTAFGQLSAGGRSKLELRGVPLRGNLDVQLVGKRLAVSGQLAYQAAAGEPAESLAVAETLTATCTPSDSAEAGGTCSL
jgi:hypothetical protein